jgi:Ca2+-binding EF-hand superfamily protein
MFKRQIELERELEMAK